MKHFTTKTRLAHAAMTLLVALLTTATAWAQEPIPYTEGFEDMSSADDLTAAGWISYQTHSGSFLAIETTATNVHSGSKALNIDSWNAGGNSDYVIVGLPTVNAAINGLQITFSYKVSTGTVDVGYLTDANDASTFVSLESYTASSNYTTVTKELNEAPATAARIAIKYLNWYRCYIDDIEVKLPPTCIKPSNLHVTATTATTATLNWTKGTDDQTAWQICLDGDEGNLITANSNSFTLTNLEAGTPYTAKVRAYCSADDQSDWSNEMSFKTMCDAYGIPYTNGFEENDPFDCWTVISGNITRYKGTPKTGSYRLDFRGTTSNMIALPQFTEPTNTLRVEFYTRPESTGGSSGKFAIGYMTDITDASTFVAVETYNSTEMDKSYVKKTVDFVDTPANAIIAMRQFDCQTDYYWYVDDVTVKEIPSCLAPTALNAGNITPTSTELSWTSDANAWTVYYKKSSDGTYNEVANVTANPYTLNGLDAASYYQFYVVANCSATDTSEPSEVFAFCTAINSYPWTENFDGITVASSSTPTLPLCWSYINTCTNNSYKYYPTINSSNATSTPNSLRFLSSYHSDPQPQYAILPPMNGLAGMQVTLKARGYNTSSTFKIGTMSDPTDASTFTLIAEQDGLTTSYPEVPFEYLIPAICTDSYLAIMIDAATSNRTANGVYIDDIEIREAPTCLRPNGLAVTETTATSATLSWTNGTEGQTAWQICINGDEEHLIDANSNPFTIEDLTAATSYTAKVRACCSETEQSEWSKMLSFNTQCEANTIYPWTENFDSYTTDTGVLPDCWSRINNTTNSSYSSYPYLIDYSAHSGSNCLRLYSFASYSNGSTTYDPQPQYAILPPMENLTGKQIMLQAKGYNTTSTFKIGTMSNPLDASTFTMIAEQTLTTSYPENPFEYLVPADCTDSYVAIMIDAATPSRTTNSVYIDDIVIREAPTCLKPTDLAVTATTTSSATLSWTNGAEGQDAWQICINGDEEHLIDANSNPFTIDNLTVATLYTAKVRAYCNETDQSEWSKEVSFTTECDAYDIPYTYGFEEAVPLGCWTVISGNVSRQSSYSNSGSYRLDFRGSTSNMIALPQFNASTNTLRVEFYTRPESNGGNSGKFAIGYITDITDVSTFVAVETYNSTEMTTTYVKKTVDLANAPTNAIIAMRQFDCATNFYWYVDDVTVKIIPSCVEPTGLAVTANSITSDGATITWTAHSETSWQVEYATDADFTNPLSVTVKDDPTYTFQGLADGTTYYVHVQADCGGTDHSEYSKTVSFNTLQTPANLPYSDNFESANGWRFLNGDRTNAWAYGEAANNGGTHAIYVSNDGGTTNAYTITSASIVYATKTFDFDAGTYVFSYDWKANGESTYDYLRVALVPSSVTLTAGTNVPSVPSGSFYDNLPTGWIALDGGTKLNQQSDWQSYVSNEMVIATAGTYMMVFAWRNDGSNGSNPPAAIDNVSIEAVTCSTPTNVTISNIKNHSAVVSWESGNDQFNLMLGEEVIPNVTNPYTLTNLTPETAYSVKVQSVCGGVDGESEWTSKSFTTKGARPTPTSLAVSNITATTVTLSWTENSDDATEWVVAYKTEGDTEYTEVTGITEIPYTLTGLTEGTVYTAKVCTVKGEEKSAWSSEISFEPTAKTVIGSGTATNSYLPSSNYYNYSLTQQIYTVAELGEPGFIESIDFYKNSTYTCERDIDIYMVSTDKSSFESNSDWIPVKDADLVFRGTVTFTDNAWTCITLDEPFIYAGTQNVAIIVDDNTGSNVSSTPFLTYTASENQAIYYYSDQNNYDPTGEPGNASSRTTSKNQIRLMKSPLGDCMKPTRLAVTEVGPNFAKLSWTENGNATEWSVVYNGNTVTTNTNDNFILEGLDNETEYTVCVYPTCDESQQSKTITFTTLAANPVPFDVTVTEVTTNGAHVSWNGYSDSYSVKLGKVNDNIVLDENFDGNVVPADWSNDNTYPWTCATHGDGYCLQSGNAGVGNSTSAISVTATYTTDGTISFDFWARGEGSSDTSDWDNCRFYIDDVQMFRYSTRTDWESYSTEVVAGTHTFKWEFKKDDSVNGTGDYFAIDNVVMSSSSINWGTPVSTTEKANTFNDLTANSKYCVQVQGKKGDNTSEWSEVVGFTTMPEPVEIELANDATNNATTINSNDGVYAKVTLSGRELYKDGYWNTLCLPFDIVLDGSPLDGAEARELSSANISGTTLNLNFSEPVNSLTAGTPYIIKWSSGATLTETDLVFDGVIVYDTDKSFDNGENGDARVRFIGTYDQKTIATEDRGVLFLGADNKLYYPDGTNGGVTIGACRAYFKIGNDGAGARLLTGFNLNFGDETNAVFDLNNKEERRNNSWYSLDGVKLDGEPTKKGLYIHGGKKVVIK